MNVNMALVVPSSTLDWPGRHVSAIFFRGCPLHCSYCANSKYRSGVNMQTTNRLTRRIKDSHEFIDGIVISGGEPFVQPEQVKSLCRYAHKLGIKTAVQTSGL